MTFFSRFAFVILWVFIFSIPSEKTIELPGIGTVTRLIGIVAVGFGGIALLVEQRVRVLAPFHKAICAFMLWSTLTVRWTVGLEYTAYRLNTYLQLLVMMLLIWQLAATEKQVHALLTAYVLGTFVPVIDAARRYLSGTMTYYERYSTTGFDPNDLALSLALSLPVSFYLWLTFHESWKGARWAALQWIFPLQMVVVCIGILLTASRGGTMDTVLALSIIFWTRRALSRRQRIAMVACVLAVAAVASVFVPKTTWKRLATLGSEVREGTFNSRTVIWKEGWRAFNGVPFYGVGAGAYPEAMAPVFGHTPRTRGFTPVAHNTFFSILVETGVIGFVLFASAIAVLVIPVYRMGDLRRAYALTLLAVLALGVFSLSWEDHKPMWFVFAILAAHSGAPRMARRAVEDRRDELRFAPGLPALEEVTP